MRNVGFCPTLSCVDFYPCERSHIVTACSVLQLRNASADQNLHLIHEGDVVFTAKQQSARDVLFEW